MKTKAENLTYDQKVEAELAMERVVDTVLQHFSYHRLISDEFIRGVMAHEHINGSLWAEDYQQLEQRVYRELATLREEIRKSEGDSK